MADPFRPLGKRAGMGREAAEALAAEIFGRLAGDDERITAFLTRTGLDPAGLRAAAAEPHFLPAVMDHVLADEPLLIAIAAEMQIRPEEIVRAGALISPPPVEFP